MPRPEVIPDGGDWCYRVKSDFWLCYRRGEVDEFTDQVWPGETLWFMNSSATIGRRVVLDMRGRLGSISRKDFQLMLKLKKLTLMLNWISWDDAQKTYKKPVTMGDALERLKSG